jgi:hypothetical protein
MKEYPILFSAPMVRALLSGSKTQTRRVCKPQPFDRSYSKHDHRIAYASGRAENGDEIDGFFAYSTSSGGQWQVKSPYGQPGDRLWVREAYADIGCRLTYRADEDDGAHCKVKKWTPSIHMFRADSRILLEIVCVRVEQLQDISDVDAVAEGIGLTKAAIGMQLTFPAGESMAVNAYRQLWELINGAGSWAANPWVWVVEFKRVLAAQERQQ